jgi:flagellar FliL protein
MAKAPTQKPDDPDVEIEQTEEGGRKKLILIGAIALVLLLGGGAAAYFVFGGSEESAEEAEQVAEPAEPEGEPTYHKLDPVFVVNLPPGGRAKMLQVGLQVYTRDPALVEHLERHEPMLRHHLFDVLSVQRADDLFERSGRERLQAALEDELREKLREAGVAEPRIGAVYFTQFVLQ